MHRGTGRRRMRQSGPVGPGYLAASDGATPERPDGLFGIRPGKLVDRDAMAVVERLVQQLSRLVVPSGEGHRGAVQFVIGVLRRREPKLLQELAQFSRGQARAQDGAMQVGVEFPDPGATRRSHCRLGIASRHQRGSQ